MLGMRTDLLLRVGLVGDVGVVGITVIIATIYRVHLSLLLFFSLLVIITMLNRPTN